MAALKTRDFVAFKRGADAGIGLQWIDSVSGLTLWHFVCGARTALTKAIISFLLTHAPLLAGVDCHDLETFEDDHAVVAHS